AWSAQLGEYETQRFSRPLDGETGRPTGNVSARTVTERYVAPGALAALGIGQAYARIGNARPIPVRFPDFSDLAGVPGEEDEAGAGDEADDGAPGARADEAAGPGALGSPRESGAAGTHAPRHAPAVSLIDLVGTGNDDQDSSA